MLHFSACREFHPYKVESVQDFESLFKKAEKQIFLFDDLFRRHNLDIYRADTFDRKFELIFELCDDNHKCIFASREYILKGFNEYTSDEIEKILKSVTIDASELSKEEKESIFLKYYFMTTLQHHSWDDAFINKVAHHQNFSPETIRAYFDDAVDSIGFDFLKHLEFPEKYLEKLFVNLNEDQKLILLTR